MEMEKKKLNNKTDLPPTGNERGASVNGRALELAIIPIDFIIFDLRGVRLPV